MDLDLSESELAFQAEARAWLAANVPAEPLPSMDTAEGWAPTRSGRPGSPRRAGRWCRGRGSTTAATPRWSSG